MMLTANSYLLCIVIPFALFLATLRNHSTSPLSTRWRGEKSQICERQAMNMLQASVESGARSL